MTRIGSLFSGIGGLERGLELAGVGSTAWQVEIDPFARSVLSRHWPEAVRYEDVRDVSFVHDVECDMDEDCVCGVEDWADVLCGGFPCQPWSNAGKRRGADDERHLWPEFARLIREVRPAWVVGENVSALLSGGIGEPLRDLAEAGYDCAWDCVPAAAVGAPHRRDRVFILAWRRDVCAPPLDVSQAWADAVAAVRGRGGGCWPAGPRQPQHAWEPPRTARGVPDRAKRLRALGNAVVPQVAEAVGLALLASRDGAGVEGERPAVARLDGGVWHGPQAGLFGVEVVERFPRAGTVRDGVAYETTPCAPLSGLTDNWNTPTASEGPQMAATPTRGMAWRDDGAGGYRYPANLLEQVARELWPTPMARDVHDTGNMSRVNARDGRPPDTLPRVVQAVAPQDIAPLNPAWVETLMGLPVGWTDAREAVATEAA